MKTMTIVGLALTIAPLLLLVIVNKAKRRIDNSGIYVERDNNGNITQTNNSGGESNTFNVFAGVCSVIGLAVAIYSIVSQ